MLLVLHLVLVVGGAAHPSQDLHQHEHESRTRITRTSRNHEHETLRPGRPKGSTMFNNVFQFR